MHRYQQPFYMMPLRGEWVRVQEKWLHEIEADGNPDYVTWDHHIGEMQRNPLAYFLPHGRPRDDEHGNDGVAFVNDFEKDLILLCSGSKMGKTFAGAAKSALWSGPVAQMDGYQHWPVFAEHKVRCPSAWLGPTEGILSSFSWDNVAVLWRTYCKVWPRAWLGPYAPNWGSFPGETGRPKALAFGDGKPKTVSLPCGVTLTMLCDTQTIVHWESRMADWGHADEQLSEEKTDILIARFQTSQYPHNPVWCTWTPFVVEDRPDTGAAGWMYTKRIDGRIKGLSYSEYKLTMDSVPDAIVTAAKKKKFYRVCIEVPERTRDIKKIHAGRAKYYAEPEPGGGIIISSWNPDIHTIEPFDIRQFSPTLFRLVDHGENPCAALLVALMPWGDAVFFSEYYEFGNSIATNAERIAGVMCGNNRVRVSEGGFEGVTWPIYDEVVEAGGMEFYASEMDARSFGSVSKESGRTIGQMYNDGGCRVTPACASHNERKDRGGSVDLLREWFELDKRREHINARLGREVPQVCKEFGAPRAYMFNTLKHFRGEIEGWVRNPKTGKPIDKNDHLVSCAKFFAARPRMYMGDYGVSAAGETSTRPIASAETGY
jgi:hypothetical protein